MTSDQLDQLCINTIRFLSVDGVQKANSGHPGAPMGMATMAYTLWTKHLRFNPKNPNWANRDRFILSNGHASMLIYSLLYLTGYDVPLDQLKQFRQWGSITPGHPERGLTPGVEVTTGPLGQGFANSIGEGIAEAFLSATFNKPNYDLFDHYTYVFMGDGCMEEAVSHEAASLGGHLQLGKIIAFYDDNGISIDGNTDITFTENVNKRFEAYGWHVQDVPDASTDIEAIDKAIREAQSVLDQPSLIVCHTHIGYGSPNRQDTAKAHGNPLGKDEIVLTKQALGWPQEEFYVPEEALEVFRAAGERGAALEAEWNKLFEAYKQAEPDLGVKLQNALDRKLADGWDAKLPVYGPKDPPIATRNVLGKALNAVAEFVPTLIGGSADLNESTFTKLDAYPEFNPNKYHDSSYAGRTINWGVREFGMGAAVNGMAAHGGVWPYGATFFTFSDYMRPAVRLAALSELPSMFVWTHDSVGLGEDGPTHQPVEHLMSLRLMPNLNMIRPADANETVEALKVALQAHGPVGFVLSRQKLPVLDQEKYAKASGLAKGAYVISEAQGGKPQLILIATGSEVSLALDAQAKLQEAGVATRVVSMPSWKLFEEQSDEYQQEVLPDDVAARLSIELGVTTGWERYVGPKGASLGIDHFGASSPYERILKEYGFTVENVVAVAQELLKDPKATQRKLRENQRKFAAGGHISTAPARGDEGHS
ncbi:MAG: transketolase [Chloroflexi bacterium]|nr:transketolase [Chloroflexota bacterium]